MEQSAGSRDNNANLETELLVSGYCHRIQKLLNILDYLIPSEIIQICLQFYQVQATITVGIGQCGNQLMLPFFKSILNEKNIDNNTYLRINDDNHAIPRCIAIDLAPDLEIFGINNLINADNRCCGTAGCGGNWAKGYYTEGYELIDKAMDILNKEIEKYDEPQTIQFMHSIDGGTGGGMGSLMMERIKDLYPYIKIMAFSIFPHLIVGNSISEIIRPYNAMLSINRLSQHCDGIFVFDNYSLQNLTQNLYKRKNVGYSDMNFICNQMINDITSIFRYNDSYGFTVNSFLNEMIKYPKLKYFASSRTPFFDENGKLLEDEVDDIFVLTKKVFDIRNNFVNAADSSSPRVTVTGDVHGYVSKKDWFTYDTANDIDANRIFTNLSTLMIYRGFDNNQEKVTESVQKMKNRRKFRNDIISSTIKYKSLLGGIQSVAMIENGTLIKQPLQRIYSRFQKMYKRKAFLHLYKGEGMEYEQEFDEASVLIQSLITDYQLIDDASSQL